MNPPAETIEQIPRIKIPNPLAVTKPIPDIDKVEEYLSSSTNAPFFNILILFWVDCS